VSSGSPRGLFDIDATDRRGRIAARNYLTSVRHTTPGERGDSANAAPTSAGLPTGSAAAARPARPRSALVPADELRCREDVAGEGPLELTPPGAEADVELGVESVQPEEVAVCAVPGRRTWPAPAAHPEVVASLGRRRLALRKPARPPGRCSRPASA
jgi:hypothetical protein